jgi:hypothetical protein
VNSFLSKTKDGSACIHPFGLSSADLNTLDTGGSLTGAQLSLQSNLVDATSGHSYRQETASANLSSWSAAQIGTVLSSSPGAGGCVISPVVSSRLLSSLVVINFVSLGLNLGEQISLSNGLSTLVLSPTDSSSPPAVHFSYTSSIPASADAPDTPALILRGGTWNWMTPGGNLTADPVPFNLQAPIQLTGRTPLTLARDRSQVISWNGTAFSADASVTLRVSTPTQAISCTAPAQSGSISVPVDLISQLSPSVATVVAQVQYPMVPIPVKRRSPGATVLVLAAQTSSVSRPAVIQ